MDAIATLQSRLQVAFRDVGLLQQALVHRSYLNETLDLPPDASNERLEFLGDAVLGLVVAEELYARFPGSPEGVLTQFRAQLVRGSTLGRVGERIELGRMLTLGRGEAQAGGRSRRLNLARALEAVIGALFLDQGLAVSRTLILRLLEEELSELRPTGLTLDAKLELQQYAQAVLHLTPEYRTVEAAGPDHAPQFVVDVMLAGAVAGTGRGPNKRLAQQEAAANALAAARDARP